MRRIIASAVAVAALTTGGVLAPAASASAACGPAGALCFQDRDGTGSIGNVFANNSWWGAFAWNDRADWFYNNGTQCGAAVFKNANFGGSWRWMDRGYAVNWYNVVSSNNWCSFPG